MKLSTSWIPLLLLGLGLRSNSSRADTQVLTEPLVRGVVFPEVLPGVDFGDATGIGDFNGDGLADFAVGAPSRLPSSIVYLIFGRREFPKVFNWDSPESTVRIEGNPTFGQQIIGAGDLDGDGVSDIYIHQTFNNQTQEDPHLYLLYGSRNLAPEIDANEIGASVSGAVLTGHDSGAHFASLADFNGDAIPDLAIGQPVNDRGMVIVLFGRSDLQGTVDINTLLDEGAGVRILGSKFSFEPFGSLLASAGDVNGDKLTDLVVLDSMDTLSVVTWYVHLIYGSRDFPSNQLIDDLGDRKITIQSEEPLKGFVPDVFGGGDLDGDGFAEFGFSLWDYDGFFTRRRLLIVKGGKDLPATMSLSSIAGGTFGFELRPRSPSGQQGFGSKVIMVPDENGDGRPEIFVGVSATVGEDLVLKGDYPILPEAIDRALHTYQAAVDPRHWGPIGTILDSAGDVNGDAVPDYLVVKPIKGIDKSNESFVYLLFGGYETETLSVTGVTPKRVPLRESTQVTISGTGFVDGMQVFFGQSPALKVDRFDPHTLLATTPISPIAQTVELAIVHPDSRRSVLPGAVTFFEDLRRFSVDKLQGIVTFQPTLIESATQIVPEVLGDINGDGLEDYAFQVSSATGVTGATYLVYGGTPWNGIVDESALGERSVHFQNTGGYVPRVLPMGDLDQDGKDEYVVTKSNSNLDGSYGFAVLFDVFPIGQDIDVNDLQSYPSVALFSSADPLGSDIWNAGDFDGDGTQDLIAAPFLILGPFHKGEKVNLSEAGNPRVIQISDRNNPTFFVNLSPIGDFNGDGLSDLAFKHGLASAIFILLGHQPKSNFLDLNDLEQGGLALKIPYTTGALFQGLNVGKAGDINDDGFNDLLFYGTAGFDVSLGYTGVFFGRKDLPGEATLNTEISGTGGFFLHGNEPWGNFGENAVVRGDVDGNGKPDLVVGSFRLTELGDGAKPGIVHIVHDVGDLRGEFSISDLLRPLTIIDGRVPTDRFGDTVRVLGDQDGDGLPELLVEASGLGFLDAGLPHGSAYLIPGASLFGPRLFIRGDANLDGSINITDPIVILGVLFLGHPPGFVCKDSADTNDDGQLNLTDAIFLLNYLFSGGKDPPSPFPEKGIDPTTSDLLDCTGA